MFGKLKQWLSGKRPDAAPPASAAPAADEAPPAGSEFLCRETLFDRRGRPAAHLFRLQPASLDAGSPAARQRDFDRILLDTLLATPETWKTGLAFVPLSSTSLDLPAVDRLQGPNLVLLLQLAPATDNERFLASIRQLQARRILIGLFRQPEHPDFARLMREADYAAIDAARCEAINIRDFSAAIRATRGDAAQLMACNLGNPDEHHFCHRWHYDLMHGNFAVDQPQRTETSGDPHRMVLLELLQLAQGDADNAAIAEMMKQDPMLGFRLLRYLNSPLLGIERQIESLNQALTIVGRQQLTRWLAVLLFSVRDPDFADWWLVESALTRGRMMELLGKEMLPGHSDALFLTGIFSRLDRLLRQPLPTALEAMPVAAPIRAALLTRSGPYASLLTLAETAETFDTGRIAAAADEAGLDAAQVNHALLTATAWTSEVTGHWS